MTAAEAPAAGSAPAPSVAWPVRVPHERAVAWLRRRVPGVAEASAQLYHHPMLATSYEVRRRDGSASAHALVDLVGGRAYATEPWEHIAFVPIADAEAAAGSGAGAGATLTTGTTPGAGGADDRTDASGGVISAPRRVLSDERGERAARDLVRSVLLRGRRLGPPGRLHPLREPLLFGKPNWWLTGTKEGRPVEIILDGLTGRHYALKA